MSDRGLVSRSPLPRAVAARSSPSLLENSWPGLSVGSFGKVKNLETSWICAARHSKSSMHRVRSIASEPFEYVIPKTTESQHRRLRADPTARRCRLHWTGRP